MTATTRSLCIVIHDVAPPTWQRCVALLDDLSAIGEFAVTLLAVPRHHGAARDPSFESWLAGRALRGDDVALHGYTHRDQGTARGPIDRLRRSVYTRGEGEFWDLPLDEARRRIDAGLAWLAEMGIAPTGFVAPAWLMGDAAWTAVRERDFAYTCTLKRFYRLPARGDAAGLACQAQVWSSSTAWRRWMSVAWNGTLARLQQGADVVRLELHPGDVQSPVRGSWQRLARRQALTRRIDTLADLARRLGPAAPHPARTTR